MTPAERPSRAGSKGIPRQERERQLLDAATAEFGTRGYAGGSVERVAAAVGVSRAMVHTYFDTKDGLYLACFERAAETMIAAVEAAQGARDPFARALDTLRAILGALEPSHHGWALLYDTTIPTGSTVHRVARGYRRRLAAIGVTGTAELLELSGDTDPDDAALLGHLWLDVVTSVVRWWLAHPDESADAACARLQRILTSFAAYAPSTPDSTR